MNARGTQFPLVLKKKKSCKMQSMEISFDVSGSFAFTPRITMGRSSGVKETRGDSRGLLEFSKIKTFSQFSF